MTSTIIPTEGVFRDCHDGQPSLTEIATKVFDAIADGTVPLPMGGIDFNALITRVNVCVTSRAAIEAWAAWLDSDIRSTTIPNSDALHHATEDALDVFAYWIEPGPDGSL